MNLGFNSPNNCRPTSGRPGSFALFTLAGLVVGIGSQTTLAQSTSTSTNVVAQSGTNHNANQNVITGKALKPKLGDGKAVEYIVKNPSWRESVAVRVVNPALPHHNIEKTLYARLLVSVVNEATLKKAINQTATALGTNRPGAHPYRPYLGMDDVFVVDALSVEDAINLADKLTDVEGVNWTEVDHKNPVQNLGGSTLISDVLNDPSVNDQWHMLNNFVGFTDRDQNVLPVYDLGISGAGVVVGVLEADENSFYHVDQNGTTFIHPDLANKLNVDLSVPTGAFNVSYSHGVSVAGLIAAEGNNGLASAGIAYGAELVSLKNGNGIDSGESLGHELQEIDIINNSWGPVNESFPDFANGKYIEAFPDDFEIDIPQVTHSGTTRSQLLGVDQGIRIGRGRKGRIFVFSAGNGSHFQGFDRLRTGNAISLPGVGTDPMVPGYGYLDITGTDPTQADGNGDAIPDVFDLTGVVGTGSRWSGHLGDRVEYNQLAGFARTLAIGAAGMSNTRTGYSTTGTSVLASTYVQDAVLSAEFTPMQGYGFAALGEGVVTLEQADGADNDADIGVDCAALFSTSFADDDLETCMFNGTSAAAPIAAGVFALMLEANPDLSIRDIQHIVQQTSIPVGFDPTHSYWAGVVLGLGSLDPDDNPNNPTPTFWTTNSANNLHSDEFGFGVIDAEAAVNLASTWGGAGQLILLDSGLVEEGEMDQNPLFTDGTVADATFETRFPISENLETNVLVPGAPLVIPISCVRDNISIESVELTLNIEGDGAGDLMIALISPRGTVSPLALPRGDSNGLNDNAYFNHTFSTYKHWGEISGGTWQLVIQDFRPDDESPEGDLPADPFDADDLGLEQVTFLGSFGLPGNPNHTEKLLASYRLKVFGTEQNIPVFEGCPPQLTSCPGDLDGNGIVQVADLQIFIDWFLNTDPRADLNGDGSVTFADLTIFRGLWVPGFCNVRNNPFTNGRPQPGSGGFGDNDPVIRPL
ncbi:MAG: S8 family serine peptidase [Phycisphaerales bacterium]|nr:S8 family serine peptidase [Phycisphaerales bacterium]